MSYTYEYLDSHSFKGDSFVEIPILNYSIYTEFTYTQGHLFFKESSLLPIKLSMLQNIQRNGRTLNLSGAFLHHNNKVNDIKMTIYGKDTQDKFDRLIDSGEFKSFSGESHKGTLIITNGEASRDFKVNIVKKNSTIEVVDPASKKKFLVLEQKDQLYLSNKVLLTFNREGYPYYLIFDRIQSRSILSEFTIVKNRYFHHSSHLSGSLGSVRFKGEEVSFMINDLDIYLFVKDFQVYSFTYDQLKTCLKHTDGRTTFQFITSEGEKSYITFTNVPKELESILSHQDAIAESIVFLEDQPYQLSSASGEWSLYQSPWVNSPIPINKIISIELLENRSAENVVSINLDYPQPYALNIVCHETLFPSLIGTTFREKKNPLLNSTKLTELYSSWSRQINDFLVYNLFGQLVILQIGIQEIQHKKNISTHKKNEQILNFMYYAIREQKRILERVSIQFPQSLMEEEQSFLFGQNEAGYEMLQKRLLSVSNQIQRNLTEIESSLNALSFAIIPRKSFDTTSKNKRNYVGAAIIGGLGILTGGVGLLAAGSLLGIKTYYGNKDTNERQQNTLENDRYKIDFYISKALDSFDHMMEIMVPYYVSQVSKVYHSVAREHCKLLNGQNEGNIQSSKKAIFERLVELYTVKQLPFEKGNLLNTEAVVDTLMTSSSIKNKLIGTLSE